MLDELNKPKRKKAKKQSKKNLMRGGNVVPALYAYKDKVGGDWCDVVHDLLSDLMHWCDGQGIDFEAKLNTARKNHAAEVAAT
jgi:hypothetical protein